MMKQALFDRRGQIQKEFKELKDKGWDVLDIYDELSKRFFLSPETIRQNVCSLGGYSDGGSKQPGVKP